jgi:hypothetical protein
MRSSFTSFAIAVALAACGGNSSGTNTDATGGGDGTGGGPDTPGGNATSISVTLTNHPNTAATFSFLVAYQDGSGPWQLAPAPTGDTYTFSVTAPAWGVVWTCIPAAPTGAATAQIRQVAAYHFAVAERTSLSIDVPPRCSDRNPTNVGLTGTVSNRSGGGAYLVSYGGRTVIANPATGAFALETPPGTRDLFLLHATPGGATGDYVVDKVVVARGVTVSAATVHNLDASTAVNAQQFTVTVAAPMAAQVSVSTTLDTASGTAPVLVQETTGTFASVALAASQATSGDVYDQTIQVTGAGQRSIVENVTATPGDQTYVAPTPLGGATSTVAATTPYPMISTSWAHYTDAVGYVWNATQRPPVAQCGGPTACAIVWAAALSPGVTGASPAYQMPDLSSLAGWNASLQLVTGTLVDGGAEAMTSTAGAMDFPAGTPAAGTQRTFVRSAYTVTP